MKKSEELIEIKNNSKKQAEKYVENSGRVKVLDLQK